MRMLSPGLTPHSPFTHPYALVMTPPPSPTCVGTLWMALFHTNNLEHLIINVRMH